jgi:phosphoribosyl-dephospho-CoA transferase
MQEITAKTIGNNSDTNSSDQKLLEKKQRALLRRERIKKYREQLRMTIRQPVPIKTNSRVSYPLELVQEIVTTHSTSETTLVNNVNR